VWGKEAKAKARKPDKVLKDGDDNDEADKCIRGLPSYEQAYPSLVSLRVRPPALEVLGG